MTVPSYPIKATVGKTKVILMLLYYIITCLKRIPVVLTYYKWRIKNKMKIFEYGYNNDYMRQYVP